MDHNILAIDDEQDFLDSIKRGLSISGFRNIRLENDSHLAAAFFEKEDTAIDIALIDVNMPGMDGITLLEHIKTTSPDTVCLMMTAMNDAKVAVQCLKKGACDYLVKPISREELSFAVNRSLERKKMLDTLATTREPAVPKLKCPEAFQDITTGSNNMFKIFAEAELHAKSDIPVLITGESGTGKDLLARAIHKASLRAKYPFTPVNMASLTEGLFDAEFCGHTSGAFTGAVHDSKGYLEQTNNGTIFMDEIGNAPLAFQAKLLRILQDGEYMKLGTSQTRKVNIRFITATNEDLELLIAKGLFRKDFYYRLNGAWLHLPPLRKRKEDIPLLIKKFLEEFSNSKEGMKVEEQALSVLMEYDYPGNIRELKSIIHSAINLAEDKPINIACLPSHLQKFLPHPKKKKEKTKIVVTPLYKVEKDHIINTYNATGRNKTQTATVLKVGINTLRRKLVNYGLE